MNLEERLNTAMEFSGCSKADLARATGASRATVTNWCNGTTATMRSEYVPAAAELFGVSAKWLSDGTGEMIDESAAIPSQALDKIFEIIAEKIQSMNDEFADAPPTEKAVFLSRCYKVAVKKL